MVLPTYVIKFLKWRDASIIERHQIAREQIRADAVADLLPTLIDGNADKIANMPAGDGKTFGTISTRERGVWVEYLRALHRAAIAWRDEGRLRDAFAAIGRL